MRGPADVAAAERLASLEQRVADHESRCEERLGEIKQSTANTLKAVEGLKGRIWTITLSLLAWAIAQVWAGSQARIAHLEAASPVTRQEVAHVSPRLTSAGSESGASTTP